MKTCKICGLEKSTDNFFRQGSGYRAFCKPCYQDYNKKYANRYRKNRSDLARQKVSARSSLFAAVRRGKMKKLPCNICGVERSEAHHHKGYDRENWRNVLWLCRKHHLEAHTQ